MEKVKAPFQEFSAHDPAVAVPQQGAGFLFPFQEGFLARVSDIKKHEKRIKETNKCNLCEYASSNAGFIRRHMKKKKMLPVQLYIVVYQETLKHSQDQRDKQVQFL